MFLPLHGEYQAQNAALALAAVEALSVGRGDRWTPSWWGAASPR